VLAPLSFQRLYDGDSDPYGNTVFVKSFERKWKRRSCTITGAKGQENSTKHFLSSVGKNGVCCKPMMINEKQLNLMPA